MNKEEKHVNFGMAEIAAAVARDRLLPKERKWIRRIEMLRMGLNASAARISIKDYGAGPAGSKRTAREMRKGKTVNEKKF